jgi:hypothetical protein
MGRIYRVPFEDVGTTKRKALTPRQRLALFERKGGRCCICEMKIMGSFIDEHWRALGLGGSNDPSNRDIAHRECAALKTQADMTMINRAKAVKRAAHGIKRPGQPLQSRNDLPGRKPKKPPYKPAEGMPMLMRQGFVAASDSKRGK